MERMKHKLSKMGRANRTFSTSNYDPSSSSPGIKKRSRSISEILDSDHTSSYHLTYHGYICVDDPRSSKDVVNSLRTIRGSSFNHKLVAVTYDQDTLRVAEGDGEGGILVCPLYSIGVVTQDSGKGGYGDCFAISFSTGHYAKQCHAFQAKSSREAASMVQAIHKAYRTAKAQQKAHRSANKERTKSRKATETAPAPAKATMLDSSEVVKVARRPMQLMEDEDEVVEMKSIGGGRRDSKKTIPALIRTGSEASHTGSSLSGPTHPPPPTHSDSTSSLPALHSKDSKRGRSGQRRTGRDHGGFNKTEELIAASERIQENNAFLRDKASCIKIRSTVFEDALYAMAIGNHTLLSSYLSQEQVVNSQDSSGNTLLHYAVALGQLHTVRILCDHNASLEASGWNDCKPIHRAVAEGHTPILQVLLKHGADVNSQDIMRRTPLHFSSAQLELMECSISLLESGAHVMTSDLLGLKPFDLNPELRETLNRLVTSACETFVSATLKDGGRETTPSPEEAPPSPHSSQSGSSLNELDGGVEAEEDLNTLVDAVKRNAQIASRAYARRKKFQKAMSHPHSRSYGNLMDLDEGVEDEMSRKDKLKFPSDCAVDSPYYQMLVNKEDTMRTLRGLIKAGKEVVGGGGKGGGGGEGKSELESSLSEPDLHRDDFGEDCDARPFSSSAVLQAGRLKMLLDGGVAKFRADSGSSSGTLREGDEDTDTDSLQQRLSRAFDVLQDDIKRSSFQKSEDDLDDVSHPDQLTQQFRLSYRSSVSADSSPMTQRRSKEQTVAIFDEIISQIEGGSIPSHRDGNVKSFSSDELDSDGTRVQNGDETQVEPDSSTGSGNRTEGTGMSIIARRVKSSDVPNNPIRRSSSSTSLDKGEGAGPDHPPRAASVETDLVFATLPKKKKGRSRWSGIKRIGSPLFKSRRKSFTSGATPSYAHTNHSAADMTNRSSISGPTPSVPVGVELNQPHTHKPSDLENVSHVAPPSGLVMKITEDPSGESMDGDELSPRDHVPRTRSFLGRRGGMMSPSGLERKRRVSAPRDECLNALKVMTTLSSNQECLSSLISYICLPKCVSKLTSISENAETADKVLSLISTLITNLYQSGGSEGKKTALGSGVLDLTIKLLQARDPIPSTCLSMLNQLLVSEDDNDYLRTIIKIPTAPLLQYLEARQLQVGGAEEDSGCENISRRDTMETRYSSDTTSTATDEGVAGMGRGTSNYLGLPPRHSARSSSFNSETSETSSGRSLASPDPPPPHLDPQRIVLKMLAVSSTHSKMQVSLATERAVSLLSGCLSHPSQENLTNSLITLANIAQNVSSHQLFESLGVVNILKSLLSSGPRPRYHASRALIYLGHLDLLKPTSGLFNQASTGYEPDTVITTKDTDGHTYARAASIEKCVELLTSDPAQLWGGFSLVMGPHPSHSAHHHHRASTISTTSSIKSGMSTHSHAPLTSVASSPAHLSSAPPLNASKDQVLQFFLTMYKSFVHPLIFVRLLRHRLSGEDSIHLFDWSNDISSISPTSAHLVSVPPAQLNVLNVIGRWLELFGEDVCMYPTLRGELERVISRLKLVRGPYIPHTHRLRSLLQDADHPRTDQSSQADKGESRPPHHDNLYRLCQQMVTGGHLPVTLEQAVFMASLQLHLEDLPGSGVTPTSIQGTPRRRGTARFKSAFPPGFSKSKSIMKRIKTQLAEFEKLSERNAKHLYIERCQANPGYDCTFFTVRVPSSGRFKRAPVAKQLMGINNKRIVFLDEKTKELIASHSLHSVLSITRESDPCVLLVSLRGDAVGFKVQVDSVTIAKEVANILEERREGEGMLDDGALRWSDSVPSLFTMSTEQQELGDTDSSSSTIDHTPPDGGATPPGHILSYDMLKNPSPDGLGPAVMVGATPTSNGHLDTMLSHKSDTLRAFSRDDSLVTDLNDHLFLSDGEKLLFCDCPPDPEIPPQLNLKNIALVDILSCPLEVARQMTLIAHERFGELTSTELLRKVNLLPKTISHQHHRGNQLPSNQRDSVASNTSTGTLRSSMAEPEVQETAVEKLAFRFNQVGNWVTHSILQFEYLDERAEVIQQFITIAKHCYDLGNFSSMMSIVVAGLGSAPIRRLHSSWAQVPKADMELFKEIDNILDSRGNYKHYRDRLGATELPAVPYVGVFLKDLTFICDGNPDYLGGGLINMHKRRQVYRLLEEIHHYQKDSYKLHSVPELRQYLLGHKLIPEDDLHSMSHSLEPRIRRTHSNSSTKSMSAIQGRSFFRGFTRTSSGSTHLNRTSTSSAV